MRTILSIKVYVATKVFPRLMEWSTHKLSSVLKRKENSLFAIVIIQRSKHYFKTNLDLVAFCYAPLYREPLNRELHAKWCELHAKSVTFVYRADNVSFFRGIVKIE